MHVHVINGIPENFAIIKSGRLHGLNHDFNLADSAAGTLHVTS